MRCDLAPAYLLPNPIGLSLLYFLLALVIIWSQKKYVQKAKPEERFPGRSPKHIVRPGAGGDW